MKRNLGGRSGMKVVGVRVVGVMYNGLVHRKSLLTADGPRDK